MTLHTARTGKFAFSGSISPVRPEARQDLHLAFRLLYALLEPAVFFELSFFVITEPHLGATGSVRPTWHLYILRCAIAAPATRQRPPATACSTALLN